jgi:CRP-like cAMP-binding protein
MSEGEFMELHEKVSILQNSRFFKGMPPDDIEKVAILCRVVHYEAGDFVFRQGEFGEFLYFIVSGQVFLERTMQTGTHQGRILIETLRKGHTLGCWSTLLGDKHRLMSSASCKKTSTLLSLPGQELRKLMKDRTSFGFNIMERLCFLLRDRIQAAYGALDKI